MNIAELMDQLVLKVDRSSTIFTKIAEAPWIEVLESKLPRRLPSSFRSLVTRYAFASFDLPPLTLFGNTGVDEEDDLNVVIFRDRIMAQSTLRNGYIQFARPDSGSYDPICFDARKSAANREYAIVRLDHEQILWVLRPNFMAVRISHKARKSNVFPRLELIMDEVLERYERICIDDLYRQAF